jgi:hypothetical protein
MWAGRWNASLPGFIGNVVFWCDVSIMLGIILVSCSLPPRYPDKTIFEIGPTYLELLARQATYPGFWLPSQFVL